MDSSWNPPTRAHYAIATHDADQYDAHLLLLSSVNVDKKECESLKERLDMMELVARRMEKNANKNTSSRQANVAVASLAAATFADKVPIIQSYLDRHLPDHIQASLTFFIGFDTVTRLFMKKYYGDSEDKMQEIMAHFFDGDDREGHGGCTVVCARRSVDGVAQNDVRNQEESELVQRPFVTRFVESRKLQIVDVEGTEGISSTRIRKLLASDAEDGVAEELGRLTFPEIVQYCKDTGLYSAR